ncbi:hypothetical protein IFM89_035622 [Coptis chinensis]|uniref:DUF4283 domain-containing protein n=1 Tax=Coptis chinensis TaxID=261450 RepID=A0A835HS10_9MAGN|nr:hypothetical protein IFM89_035622 [Coptis chinensis]
MLIGFFLDKRMSFPFVKNALEKTWKLKGSMDITTDRDLFYMSFTASEDKQAVLEGGPIFIAGKIFVVMPWTPEAENQRNNVSTVPIWAKLSKVPKELWTKKGLSFLASLIGGPLCMDGATSMKRRLDFAKVCVTIPLDFDFPSTIKLKIRGKHVFVDVEYPWKPPSCSRCSRFGHLTARCPTAPTQVWVPRTSLIQEQNPSAAAPAAVLSSQNAATLSSRDLAGSDVLSMINVAVDNRESPCPARTSARHQHDRQPPLPLLEAVVSRESPSTATTAAVASAAPSTQVVYNRCYSVPAGPEEMSSTNGLEVTRGSSSSDRMSARSPSSLVRAVVSRESPSTAMTSVGTHSSPSLLRPSKPLTRYNKDGAGSLGPLLATPFFPRLLSSATDGSPLNKQTGSSPFPLGNSSSLTSSRVCENPRGKEVVVYTTHELSQEVLEQEVGSVTAEELFQFNVDNNAYAALVTEEEGPGFFKNYLGLGELVKDSSSNGIVFSGTTEEEEHLVGPTVNLKDYGHNETVHSEKSNRGQRFLLYRELFAERLGQDMIFKPREVLLQNRSREQGAYMLNTDGSVQQNGSGYGGAIMR